MPARLPVWVQPRASRNAVSGWQDGALRVRLTAPPVDNAANKALVDFMASVLGVRRAHVALVSGDHSRHKVLEFATLTPEELARRLDTLPT